MKRGNNINGTKYNRAGCAALKNSDDKVAVSSPAIMKKGNKLDHLYLDRKKN